LTSQPTEGFCNVPLIFHIESGRYGDVALDGLNVLHMSVDPLPTMHPSGEMWANLGHPVSPDKMLLAVGAPGNTFSDHGMRWDNSGRNGLYAPIRWSNLS
jgi:hypothetical protein